MKKRLDMMMVLLFTALISLAGCGDDEANDDHGDEHAEPAADGCEHAQQGPYETVAATAAVDATTPALVTHTFYTITVPGTAGDPANRVTFTPDEAGEYLLFFGSDDAQVEVTAGGTALAEELREPVDQVEFCPELAVGEHYDLAAATTYTLALTGATEFGLVIIPAEAGHGDE